MLHHPRYLLHEEMNHATINIHQSQTCRHPKQTARRHAEMERGRKRNDVVGVILLTPISKKARPVIEKTQRRVIISVSLTFLSLSPRYNMCNRNTMPGNTHINSCLSILFCDFHVSMQLLSNWVELI